MAGQKASSERLFEIEIGFHGHVVYSISDNTGAPRSEICSKEDHSGCNVGEYAKNLLENVWPNIKIKKYEVGQTKVGSSYGKPIIGGLLKLTASAPEYVEEYTVIHHMDGFFKNGDPLFHLHRTSYLSKMNVKEIKK